MSVQRSKPEAGNVEELGNTAGAHRVLFFFALSEGEMLLLHA